MNEIKIFRFLSSLFLAASIFSVLFFIGVKTSFADISNINSDTLSGLRSCVSFESNDPLAGYEYLGQGLAGKLSQVDIKLLTISPATYGKAGNVEVYESDDYLDNLKDISASKLVWGYSPDLNHTFNISDFDGVMPFSNPYLGSDYEFNPLKYYYLVTRFSAYSPGVSCQPYYLYGSLDSNSYPDGEFYSDSFVKDIYFNLHGLDRVSTSTVPATSENSSVLFLPGIEGSRLYRGARPDENILEHPLWEPHSNQDVEGLFLDDNGKQPDHSVFPENNVYTRDVVDEAYFSNLGPNIYKSFLDQLGMMKNEGTIADYSAVPYDWRLSLDDILNGGTKDGNKIYYADGVSADPYIMSELRRLVASSQNGKVTIVAHSNGGLVAKALLKRLSDQNDPLLDKIDKVIFVAVPQIGTPLAIGALLNGFNQGLPTSAIPVFLSDSVARSFAVNSPMSYNLLPDENYFSSVNTPVITFDSSAPDWIKKYGSSIQSENILQNFLTDTAGRVNSASPDTNVPISVNSKLLSDSENVHSSLDNWQIPETIPVIEIAGWGIPTTMSGIKYSMKTPACVFVICLDKTLVIKPEAITTIDGDGTVVAPSALWAAGANTTRYWVDEGKYNRDNSGFKNAFGLNPLDHKNILEIPEILSLIKDNINGSNLLISPVYISTSTPTRSVSDTRLIYSLHSPLTLDIYDDLGNHTGISTTTGATEEQVPGTYYLQLGDVKYIFTETDIPTHISMTGYDTGTFTFNIDELRGDDAISSVTFQDIPTTPTTKVSMNISGDISTLSPLYIDTDNNGVSDINLDPIINEVVNYSPPTAIVVNPVVSDESPALPVGGNGPIYQNTVVFVSTSTVFVASSTVAISTSSPILSLKIQQKKDLPKISIKPKVSTSTTATKNQNIEQTAQIVSANSGYTTKFLKGFGSFFKKMLLFIKY